MKLKVLFSYLLTSTLLLALFIPFCSISTSAALSSLTTNKTVYSVGEPIYVTATSTNISGKDWIGIASTSNNYAIRWDYLSNVGDNTKIDARNLNFANSGLSEYLSFPAGDYVIYFIANDATINDALSSSSKLISKINIKITDNPENYTTTAPSNVTYTLKDSTSGFADGTLNITLPQNHNATDIYMWWGDNNGKLEGYTMLSKFKIPSGKSSFTHQMTPNTIIPKGATKLLVYTYGSSKGLSQSAFECKLPNDINYIDINMKPEVEFQVLSDIHISDSSHTHNANFIKALQDIAVTELYSQGIFVVGDMVDNGGNDQHWRNFWSIYDNVNGARTLPHMYISLGNHDTWNLGSYDKVLSKFLSNLRMPNGAAKPTTAYYETWIGDYQFISLATTTIPSDSCHAIIGDAQYKWLEQKLKANKTDNPIFIFMHQALENTVAGSATEEGWWGIEDDDKLRELLKEYPQIRMFNGHSHWTLDSNNTMYQNSGEGAIFNTSSAGYLWHSYNKVTGEALAGSQGYYVRVYEDKTLVLGRDFITGEWVSSAQFAVSNLAEISEPTVEDDVEDDIEETESPSTDSPTETDVIISTDSFNDTDVSTDIGGVTDVATDETKEKGCKSTLSACLPATIATITGALVVSTKKRKKQ